MDAQHLLSACAAAGIDFFTGVPDSQLKGLCDTLYATYGVDSKQHIVAANEGNAIGLCAGHYLATGRPALCYMQNSGLGNAVNPIASLMDAQVYGLPCLLVVGWRGEPGVHDEPQHVKQGQITLPQLELLDVPCMVLDKAMSDEDFDTGFAALRAHLKAGRTAAIVVKKGALSCSMKAAYGNAHQLSREDAAAHILQATEARDVVVSTTGKLSRELFELREAAGQGHERDFLTVGSMGHASMIALGIAQEQPDRRIWCLDGDGAALMHLGAMAVLGQRKPANLLHVVVNNAAHETVGGMPVCEGALDVSAVAKAVGYEHVFRAEDASSLDAALAAAKACGGLALVEVLCAVGARADLGRPTTTPQQNRDALMAFLQETRLDGQAPDSGQ
ncbi:MAG: phosphonopyruvate decarboxylase [Aristaeellaceae bacterium]